jgi:HK97 family phage portal protein
MALTGAGHAFLLVTAWDAADRPMAVKVLDPSQVTAVTDPVAGVTSVTWDGRRFIVGRDVIHIPNVVDGADQMGQSPLQLCGQVLAQASTIYGYRGSYYDEGGVPSVKIKVPHRLTTEQANAERDAYIAARWGRRVPAVVSGGTDIEPFYSTAQDAQLSEAIDSVAVDIARIYRVMPSLVNVTTAGSLTYATTADHFRAWLITGLQSYLMRLEAAFSDLLPRGQTARFDTSELTRTDVSGRWAAYATALAGAPWLTVDEVRGMEGRVALGERPAEPATPADAAPVESVEPVAAPNLEGV